MENSQKSVLNTSIILNFIMGVVIFFFVSSWLSSKNVDNENKALRNEIISLEQKKNTLIIENQKLVETFEDLELSVSQSKERIKILETGLSNSDRKLQDAKTQVQKEKEGLDKLNAEIDNLRKGTFIISNDSLLISLKQKLNR